MQRTSGLRSASVMAAENARSMSRSKALRFSGRWMPRTATWPRYSRVMRGSGEDMRAPIRELLLLQEVYVCTVSGPMKPEKEEGALTGARRIPWAGPRGLDAVLQGWRSDRQLWPSIVLDEVTPAREGVYASIPEDVAPEVRA